MTYRDNLTGRARFRSDWRGRQILQVETESVGWAPQSFLHNGHQPLRRIVTTKWRDATREEAALCQYRAMPEDDGPEDHRL